MTQEMIQESEQTSEIEEAGTSSIDVSSSADIEGASSLMDTIEEGASSFDVRGFECAECGVHHGHSDTKHQAASTFALSADDAASTFESNSSCHCGYNEAAMRSDELGIDAPSPDDAFSTAPIPEGHRREMEQQFE